MNKAARHPSSNNSSVNTKAKDRYLGGRHGGGNSGCGNLMTQPDYMQPFEDEEIQHQNFHT